MHKPDNKPNKTAPTPKPTRDKNGRFAPKNGDAKKKGDKPCKNLPKDNRKKKHCTCTGKKDAVSQPELAAEFVQSILEKRPSKVTIDNLVFYSEPCIRRIVKYYRNKCDSITREHMDECKECTKVIDECMDGCKALVAQSDSLCKENTILRWTSIFSFVVAAVSLVAVGWMLFFGHCTNPPGAYADTQGEVSEVVR